MEKKKKTELKDKNLQIRLDPLNISPMTGEIPTNSLSGKSWEHFPEAKKKKSKSLDFVTTQDTTSLEKYLRHSNRK